jgi:hypothetical protein
VNGNRNVRQLDVPSTKPTTQDRIPFIAYPARRRRFFDVDVHLARFASGWTDERFCNATPCLILRGGKKKKHVLGCEKRLQFEWFGV